MAIKGFLLPVQKAFAMPRHDGRSPLDLRPISITPDFLGSAPGSVLIKAGRTTLLCTASVDTDLPPWKLKQDPPTGWLTAEYNMLPGSTNPRKRRDRSKVDGRTTEIQRLIGRSLRAGVDFTALGARSVTIDCDVLEADGGTRTLGITGGFIALCLALYKEAQTDDSLDPSKVITQPIAAISVGICKGECLVDLDYSEDSTAEVDLNLITTGSHLVEVQGSAEGKVFSREQLDDMLNAASGAIEALVQIQRETLGEKWPLDQNS